MCGNDSEDGGDGIIEFVMKVVEGLARLKWMHAINFRDIIHDAKNNEITRRNYYVVIYRS